MPAIQFGLSPGKSLWITPKHDLTLTWHWQGKMLYW
ncbi:MAG: hypothetical protein BECKG1743D_GA0114223_112341 [Candidatus Kentron sp. G]|nr:MAG: hypothetical protein BECKG1743D_GA0114223_112341 [Candidatus Kentron sp. G]